MMTFKESVILCNACVLAAHKADLSNLFDIPNIIETIHDCREIQFHHVLNHTTEEE